MMSAEVVITMSAEVVITMSAEVVITMSAVSSRWVGLCGSVLDTSQCGDSVICNIMYKFSSLCDIQSEI